MFLISYSLINLDAHARVILQGQGIYAFVPDGSFVGTAFVNATSNILATAARNVRFCVNTLINQYSLSA
jgi:hypothetical protein